MSGDGVSEVSPQTGALLAGPFQVAHLVDGNGAYPLSAEGRQTYQDSQFAPRGRLSRPPVLRPAPTAARPPKPLPGITGYRPDIASLARRRRGQDGSPPGFRRRPFTRSNAHYAGGFLSARSWNKDAFHGLRRVTNARLPLGPPQRTGPHNDAYSGFTHVADRAIASAPLRTRPLDHARGHRYQGPRRLPGPDSHRQAIVNLSLLRHTDLPFLTTPEQSRRTATRQKCGSPPSMSSPAWAVHGQTLFVGVAVGAAPTRPKRNP